MIKKTMLCGLALFSLSACGGEGDFYEEEDVATQSAYLFADTNLLYMPTGNSHTTRIDLCWKNSNSGYNQEMGWVESVVNAGWEDNSWIDFRWQKEWLGECTSGSVPLHNKNEWPNGWRDEVNFNFIDVSSYDGQTRGCSGTQNCIQSVAIHEIGHVLGFDHEHAHKQLNCSDGSTFAKDDGTYTVDGDLRLINDPDSVMGGCPTGFVLPSSGDILALHSVYGGSGVTIDHNAYITIRESNAKYWRYSSGTFSTQVSYSTRWRMKRSGQSSGAVKYGEKISIRTSGGTYMCGQKGTSGSAPKLKWTTSYSSASCDWEVKQSSSGNAGGTTLNVNDPFKLYLKIPASNGSETTFEQTTGTLRAIKTTI